MEFLDLLFTTKYSESVFLMTNKQKNFCLGGLRLGLGIHY